MDNTRLRESGATVAEVSQGLAVPRVSVCLPTYNRAHYVGETIASILAQTMPDFELIVADNCSTDSTAAVVAGFDDARIRYVRRERNLGHYQNMNAAVEVARGRYVCVIHDDDIYAPDFLARESEMLDRHPNVGMVHCAIRLIDPDRRLLALHRVAPRDRVAPGRSEFLRYLGGHDVACSTVMCRRDVWLASGGFEAGLMCADWLMWLKIALRADVAYVAAPLADVRVHPRSISSSMDPIRWYHEFVEVGDRALSEMRELNLRLDESPDRLRRIGNVTQSRRFLVAALAAAADGAQEHARGYLDVLDHLRRRGAPPYYVWAGRLLAWPPVRPLMRSVRAVRRALLRSRVENGPS